MCSGITWVEHSIQRLDNLVVFDAIVRGELGLTVGIETPNRMAAEAGRPRGGPAATSACRPSARQAGQRSHLHLPQRRHQPVRVRADPATVTVGSRLGPHGSGTLYPLLYGNASSRMLQR
jgi:hypothetical protein